jgi:hypothetical protein
LPGRHWHTLRELGFVTDDPSVIYRELDNRPTYVETFTWVEGGFEQAHEHPAVLAIWEPRSVLSRDRAETAQTPRSSRRARSDRSAAPRRRHP